MKNNNLLRAAVGLVGLLPAAAVPLGDIAPPPIVGGTDVPSASTFPYIVALLYDNSLECGGSILTPHLVVTAAHCVSDGTSASSLKVRVGSLKWASGGSTSSVSSFTIHPQYDSSTNDYDIAVLKLSTALKFSSTVAAATLVASGADPAGGETTTVIGWGTTSEGASSVPPELKEVDVPIVARTTCQSEYGTSAITSRMFCAGLPQGGKDSCQGDSGGPIIDKASGVLLGGVDWGNGCAEAGYAGVYTSYADTEIAAWIQTEVAANP